MENVLILLPFASTGVIVYVFYLMSFAIPVFVEFFYSRGVYPVISALSFLTANLPFSFAELLVYAFLIFLVIYIALIIRSVFKTKRKCLKTVLFRFAVLAIIISNLYASFVLGWSLNYARLPLSQSLGLDASPASVRELYNLSNALAIKANSLRAQTGQDQNGVFKLNRPKEIIVSEVKTVFKNNAPSFMNLGSDTNVKGVATYNLLSRFNILGIFIPFTGEPNINMQMPDLYFASSALHEYAHYKGFAREDEANFIAYYVSKDLPDTDFSYSSTMLALSNALNQLNTYDSALYNQVFYSLSDGVIRDFSNENTYWAAFKDSRQTVETMNNNYLLLNNQKDGVQSYGRMVDLLIALQRAGEL